MRAHSEEPPIVTYLTQSQNNDRLPRMRKRLQLIALAVLPCLFCITTAVAEAPAKDDPVTVIHLLNGDYVTGSLIDSTDPALLAWQSPAFTQPFQFELGGISSIHFPVPDKLPTQTGDYCMELAGGDVLFGTLIGIDANSVILDVDRLGRMNINRNIVRRLFRVRGNSDQIFVGPNGLNGWKASGAEQGWREDAGNLIGDKAGAVLFRDFGIPNQARIEFELSWTTQPSFELALGVSEDAKTILRAFSFEVWENDIVVKREAEGEADVVSLQESVGKSGRLHLQAFLDQQLGRLLVYSSNGKPLADLTVQTAKPQVHGGLQITNRSGDVRIESLRISRWNGELPRKVERDQSRIHSSDGTIIYGSVTSFDSEKREFVIGDEANSARIAEDKIHDVFFSQSEEPAPPGIRAVFFQGHKISGSLIAVKESKVGLKIPGVQETLEAPIESLQSLVVVAPQTEAQTSQASSLPRARLEAKGTRLHGSLVDTPENAASCLIWQPARSKTASPLRPGLSAQIIYKETAPPVQADSAQIQRQAAQARLRAGRGGGIVAQIQDIFLDGEPANKKRKTSKKSETVLHLRTGDKLPCKVISMDERGVTLESPVSEVTFVPNENIQALELISDAPAAQIQTQKRQRLLTLPRMQRDNPPTHLVRSVDGDYLRGRIVSMDEAQMQIELRLEPKIIRRDRIVRILWLHPESVDPAAVNPDTQTEKPEAAADSGLVQALQSDGNRLTFTPKTLSGSVLSGRSELLGACHLDLQQIDQLLIGDAVKLAAAGLPFHDWKLKPAADPLAPKEGSEGSGEGGEGQESLLVGKPAPAIALEMLDGTKFVLADHKQKVVILDFWASWCGPCLQVMPQIDEVAHEFADQGVELFAVNLEESPEKIKKALERLKLSTTVVLDQNGRIAEKYGATSIPQTVIIDREGNVARVFVGGGARFDDQLRAALKTVLSGETPKETPIAE